MLIFCTNKVLTAIKRPDTIVVAIPPTNGLVRAGFDFFRLLLFRVPCMSQVLIFHP